MARVLALASVSALLLTALALPARAAPNEEDDESSLLVLEARKALELGQLDKAGSYLEQALALNPRRLDAYLLRASTHARAGDHTRAVEVLRRAIASGLESIELETTLATELLHAGEAEPGLALLEKIVSTRPELPQPRRLLGHEYIRRERWENARRTLAPLGTLEDPTATREDKRRTRLDLAQAYLRTGAAPEAFTLYQSLAGDEETSTAARLGMLWATSAIDCRRVEALVASMGDVVSSAAEVDLVRGRCALLLGETASARQRLADYQRRGRDDAWGRELEGDLAMADRQVAQAELSFAHALRLAPGAARLAFKLARAERLAGKPAQAEARLRALPSSSAQTPTWTLELTEALLAQNRASDARELLIPWLEKNASEAQGYAVLGLAQHRENDIEGALGSLERALALGYEQPERVMPPLVDALRRSGEAQARAGQWNVAQERFRRATQVEDTPRNWLALGLVMVRTDAKRAATELASPARRHRDPALSQVYARALRLSGSAEAAVTVMEAVLNTKPEPPRRPDLALELAACLMSVGKLEPAYTALERTLSVTEPGSASGFRLLDGFAKLARHLARAYLSEGKTREAGVVLERATSALQPAVAGHPGLRPVHLALLVDQAVVSLAAGRKGPSLALLKTLPADAASIGLSPPLDRFLFPLLRMWNGEEVSERSALDLLSQIRSASGPGTQATRRLAAHAANRLAAERRSDGAGARQLLAMANSLRPGDRFTTYNLAVLDLATARAAEAEANLQRLSADLPQALIALGVARELRGEQRAALDYYRRALARGARFEPLGEWIAVKERLWEPPP